MIQPQMRFGKKWCLVFSWLIIVAVAGEGQTSSGWATTSPRQQADLRSVKALYPPTVGTALSLKEAILQALEYNLDIHISQQTREQYLTDILFQQAQFDPAVELAGRYDRSIAPLNRPVFGFGGVTQGTDPQKFDQNDTNVNFNLTQRLLTGTSYDLTFNNNRNSVAGQTGFLFNPSYQSDLSLTLTQSLLRNFGPSINATQITIARNTAERETYAVTQQILTTIAQVEQTYWELVFARQNLIIAQGSLRAAEDLMASNQGMVKAGVMSEVDVLQARTAVANRIEQIFLAHKAMKDQEDQLRRLFSPSEWDLRQTDPLIPREAPMRAEWKVHADEGFQTALTQRPEILQAQKNRETAEVNTVYAKNQLLPELSLQGIVGVSGLGDSMTDNWDRMKSTDFYNMGGGLVLSIPLGNRAAKSQYDRRRLESQQQETILQRLRQQIIVEVKEARRQVQTNHLRLQTNEHARKFSEEQLAAERQRLGLGLSTTRAVLEFQRELRLAQGRELRALIDYNQALSRFRFVTASVLEHYDIQLK